jgi:hypothetical protein
VICSGRLRPIDAREQRRAAALLAELAKKADQQRERWTLARCARDYHERVIEPTRTTKHAAQWIASLENHIPPAIWNKPVDQVEAAELLRALQDITPHERARNFAGDKPQETMERVRQRLDAVFDVAPRAGALRERRSQRHNLVQEALMPHTCNTPAPEPAKSQRAVWATSGTG